MAKLFGITRAEKFSPNMTKNDRDIFMAVTKRLEENGNEVSFMEEEALSPDLSLAGYDLVFTMLRGDRGIALLKDYARLRPGKVVNSPEGIEDCRKDRLTGIMQHLKIPMPRSYVLSLTDKTPLPDNLFFPLWLKRGDGCAQCKDDVTFVEDNEGLLEALCNYKVRGVTSVVLSRHIVGDIVKFYSVEGTAFFDWNYADPRHSKFGNEWINGASQGYTFDVAALKTEADRLAAFLGVPVFGGDCVVDARGHFRIIDFNDWPSFSRCRYRASIAIADRIMKVLDPNSPPLATVSYHP